MAGKSRTIKVFRVGRLDYGWGLGLQKILAENHRKQLTPDSVVDSLILVEHDPVYTVGIRDKMYDETSESSLRKLGADYYRTNRGGLITFHGPGQLVAYPIIDLRRFDTTLRRYVCQIEKTIVRLCAEFGIRAGTTSDTGVWVEDRKICAIGIHASRYVTSHGLALNCNTDLSWFDHIVPCGIEGKTVTSISRELNTRVSVDDVIPIFLNAFKDQFRCNIEEFSLDEAANLLHLSNPKNNKVNKTCSQ